MNMVGHYGEGMTNVMTEGVRVVMDGFDDHVRDCWLAKVERTAAGFVQQSVQCDKRPSGGGCGCWEGSIRRQTAVEAPREEYGPGAVHRDGEDAGGKTSRWNSFPDYAEFSRKDKPTRGSAADRGSALLNDGVALDVKFCAC